MWPLQKNEHLEDINNDKHVNHQKNIACLKGSREMARVMLINAF